MQEVISLPLFQPPTGPSSVPIFALHPKGAYYIPLSVDYALIAPYLVVFAGGNAAQQQDQESNNGGGGNSSGTDKSWKITTQKEWLEGIITEQKIFQMLIFFSYRYLLGLF